MPESDSGPGMDHVTVKPEQLRRDEVHIVVTGDDLNGEIPRGEELIIASRVKDLLYNSPHLDVDDLDVRFEYTREEK